MEKQYKNRVIFKPGQKILILKEGVFIKETAVIRAIESLRVRLCSNPWTHMTISDLCCPECRAINQALYDLLNEVTE
jgi:hypothetical protein